MTLVGGNFTGDLRPRFETVKFVASGGTLHSLSKEGQDSADALVTALTAAVESAENLATPHPGGRLRTPMLVVLDEAANVCRWMNLPDLYSHFGSRGIPICRCSSRGRRGQSSSAETACASWGRPPT